MQINGSDESKDMLYIVGGLALLVAGAGLLMSHPNTAGRCVQASKGFCPMCKTI